MPIDLKELEARLDFENVLDPVQIPFKYNKRVFILREATGDAWVDYQDAINSARIYDAEGKQTGFKRIDESNHVLIAKCLVETTGGELKAVDPSDVRCWPRRVLAPLYRTIREISDFDSDQTEEELLEERNKIDRRLAALKNGSAVKNGQGSSTTGSDSLPSSDRTQGSS